MATLATDNSAKTPSYTIQWYEGKHRRTIYIGGQRFNKQTAFRLKEVVEALLYYRDNQILVPEKSIHTWIENAPDIIRDKLCKAGLIAMPKRYTCSEIWKRFLNEKNYQKKNTNDIYLSAKKEFFEYFSENQTISELKKSQFEEWKAEMLTQSAVATVATTLKSTKAVFNWAVKKEFITESPLKGVGRGSFVNRANDRFVTMDEYRRILEQCPNQTWRTLFAFVRIGGLRCPSEILMLKWQDIAIPDNRFIVRSPKTEHHEAKDIRTVPLFSLLLEEIKKLETEKTGDNLFVNLSFEYKPHEAESILEKAGLSDLPRPFDNMRASRSNEVYRRWGDFIESEWIGHSSRVRSDHYLNITDDDFVSASKE
jgi:integrase